MWNPMKDTCTVPLVAVAIFPGKTHRLTVQ